VDIEVQGRPAGAQTVNQVYLDTARLLTQVAPLVFVDNVFALKGGTAINLFVRDMPRLSVDMDLVFVDHRLGRDEALAKINDAIRSAVDRLKKRGFQTHTAAVADAGETKLFVRRDKLEVKVEVNFVLRGTVHPIRLASLTPRAQEALLADLELPIVSLEDLYGGKLVAALDRQHPRDLFDVMQLFLHEGITPGIRRSFVVYLASHNRPIHEVLFPNLRDVSSEYEGTFRGMTTEPVELKALLSARERMVAELQAGLDVAEREFLLSLARNEPNWDLLGLEHVEQLPGVRWKLENLGRLEKANPKKFKEQAQELERLLGRSAR
jgi:predicted nucleotidyltransferase component of viral defense system